MTEVLHSPYSSPSSSSLSCAPPHSLTCAPSSSHNDTSPSPSSPVEEERERERAKQLSLLALLVAIFRKSLVACKSSERREICGMEIGWPTNVRHVAHVTFDRFNGFLGLPVEFEPEVPRRAPSASARVFGVSTDSMQLSYDTRGNSVPTILLLMQRRLYAQGGLQAEGIFRINAENSQEEYVRDQLNRGVVPEGIDVHCLAGLIKAWFRELPRGILDPLSPERVMQCETEEDCAELVRLLPPTEAALLDWAINLMADVVQMEHLNKMNARNIAMVFAPNMTQMADPLTALMYAVQVMNFLKMLVIRTLREREDSKADQAPASHIEPFDENGRHSPSFTCVEDTGPDSEESELSFAAVEPSLEGSPLFDEDASTLGGESRSCIPSEWQVHDEEESCEIEADKMKGNHDKGILAYGGMSKNGQTSASALKWVPAKIDLPPSAVHVSAPVEKTKGISNLRRIDSRIEWIEAWR